MADLDLDAVVLLYLIKTWNEDASLLECAQKFQQTRSELAELLSEQKSEAVKQSIENGTIM